MANFLKRLWYGKDIRTLTEVACLESKAPDYALLFFDHLRSEYLVLKSNIEDPQLRDLLESTCTKRQGEHLTWSDIYTFDLAMIDVRPLENLIRKAYDARAKYRSIAGQKEYDEYLASKPPDLTSILIAPKAHSEAQPASATATENAGPPMVSESSPPADFEEGETPAQDSELNQPVDSEEATAPGLSRSTDIIQRVLRADIRYLLSKFYLYYAMLPMREKLREELTLKAVRMTRRILIVIIGLIMLGFGGALILEKATRSNFDLRGAFGLTVGSVALAGIVGGCVSMLQRIQSTPSEGDALFNLASLTNGWTGLSLSPLYGGIFASLLFVLFAAGILEGSVFPKINTPGKLLPPTQSEATTTAPTAANSSTPDQSQPNQQVPPSPAAPTPAPPTQTQKLRILQATDFLRGTGPTDGVSFALLIIWSFIAGFAERLVPDTLNRLVAKNAAIQGTNS